MDVAELCDAKAVKCGRKAIEYYRDLADPNFMRLVKTVSEGTRSQRTCAETKKFTSGE